MLRGRGAGASPRRRSGHGVRGPCCAHLHATYVQLRCSPSSRRRRPRRRSGWLNGKLWRQRRARSGRSAPGRPVLSRARYRASISTACERTRRGPSWEAGPVTRVHGLRREHTMKRRTSLRGRKTAQGWRKAVARTSLRARKSRPARARPARRDRAAPRCSASRRAAPRRASCRPLAWLSQARAALPARSADRLASRPPGGPVPLPADADVPRPGPDAGVQTWPPRGCAACLWCMQTVSTCVRRFSGQYINSAWCERGRRTDASRRPPHNRARPSAARPASDDAWSP